eukprot:6478118-Amphidinium_carterae.1
MRGSFSPLETTPLCAQLRPKETKVLKRNQAATRAAPTQAQDRDDAKEHESKYIWKGLLNGSLTLRHLLWHRLVFHWWQSLLSHAALVTLTPSRSSCSSGVIEEGEKMLRHEMLLLWLLSAVLAVRTVCDGDEDDGGDDDDNDDDGNDVDDADDDDDDDDDDVDAADVADDDDADDADDADAADADVADDDDADVADAADAVDADDDVDVDADDDDDDDVVWVRVWIIVKASAA